VKEVMTKDSTERGMGLAAMDERAQMLGGALDLWSQKGKGTRISFKIPLKEEGIL